MKEIKYSEKEKVYQNMSLVGIIKINNGIIAFGDSKSTLYDINGSPYWDKDRITQKVFVNKCFLLTTYGINTCMISGKMVYLENVLNEAIKDDYSHEQEFLQNIHNQIKETYIKYPDNHYRFIIGRKDIHNQFYIAVYTLNKDGVFCDMVDYSNNMVHCSTPCCATGLTPLETWTIDDAKKAATHFIEATIKLGDDFLAYNPVGGDIYIATMDINGNITTYINGVIK